VLGMEATGAADAVQGFRDALASLAGIDPADLADPAVRGTLLALLQGRNQLDAIIAKVLGVFDDRAMSKQDGFRTTKQWLAAFGRLSGPAAKGQLRAVEVTRLLPQLAAAFAAGEVSAEHVNRIGLTAEDVGEEVIKQAESTLVPLAQESDPETVGEACAYLRDLALADKTTPREEQIRRRSLSLARVGEHWKVRGTLDPETGTTFTELLDTHMGPPAPGDDRSPAQRRHDAFGKLLANLARAALAPEAGGLRPHIGLVMPVGRYADLHDHTPTTRPAANDGADSSDTGDDRDDNDIDDGIGDDSDAGDGPAVMTRWGVIPDALAARLSCDATLQHLWLHPENGIPLKLGRAYRNTPPALRRVLAARDPHCRWPGCTTPANWCDSHHLREWIRHHGNTDVDNLILLCRWHHVCVHERRWGLHRDPANGLIHVTRPDGTPYELLPSQPRTGESYSHQRAVDDPPST